ncbi:hypothetical protein SDC9_125804 [bioreactor metagenome]|uniref:Uncharacterized protein n=1 Tax=bioreactor metagenome TaxID=1076179 RepID=A0A645CPE9_9ZZZZ
MAEHRGEGERRPDRRGKPRAHDAHIAGEDEKVIAGDIEESAEKHRGGGEPGAAVVAQESGQHLVEDKQRNGEFYRLKVLPRKRQKSFLRAEEQQHPPVEKNDRYPTDG